MVKRVVAVLWQAVAAIPWQVAAGMEIYGDLMEANEEEIPSAETPKEERPAEEDANSKHYEIGKSHQFV